MSRISIKLIAIGHVDKIVNFKSLKNHKSKLFEIEDLNRTNDLPSPKKNDGFLDVVYSVDEVKNILSNTKCKDLCIGIMNYRFEDNFYMHRINDHTICISVAYLDQLLNTNNISVENFILKNIYETIAFFKIFDSTLSGDVYEFVHNDTRGCLFDLNGDRNDIIYNTEKPDICYECLSKMNKKTMPNDFVGILKSELKGIDKSFFIRAELFIKKYPLLSIVLTIILSTSINIFSSFIWNLISG